MAATLHPIRNESGGNVHTNLYPRTLMTEFDLKDNRYPTISSQTRGNLTLNSATLSSDLSAWEKYSNNEGQTPRKSHEREVSSPWLPEASIESQQTPSRRGARSPDTVSAKSQSQQSQDPQRSSLSYALPVGGSRRVVERYSLDENPYRAPSRASTETRPTLIESAQGARSKSSTPQPNKLNAAQERPSSIPPSAPRHPAVPVSSISVVTNANQFPPIMPLSASPRYSPPIAPRNRAYPQQPTYINPSNAPKPINTIYTPQAPQSPEEVCVECAMRDQDMADVDVTSPGVWERASDAFFEDLKQRESDEEARGIVCTDESRPRSRGGRLTEQNLKIWLSINPREPASRQQTLNTYIKSQRALLEAEAMAHARAMQEAKQLDNKMRDAYSQLRRSAYDMGSTSSPADDIGAVRIKPPQSPANNHSHNRSHSREITLLENGMIVEHVDVRKEEREARERRRKEEKRARKSSRSSVMDVTSIISAQSNGALTENGLKPYSRYSVANSARPTSVLTAPHERPDLPRAYSQASFSDVHSLGSASPRRTRFFGMRNLSTGWRSQDSLAPSGMSGSMVDMHVALQREGPRPTRFSPNELGTSRRSQLWPTSEGQAEFSTTVAEEKAKKKKSGLIKFWRIVTGSGRFESSQPKIALVQDRHEDDLPLAPPPPLSYLVERGPSDLGNNNRHASTPSLPSVTSPKFGQSASSMSPPTAPSSILPSPTSLRQPAAEKESSEIRTITGGYDEQDRRQQDETVGKIQGGDWKGVHPVLSEPDMRQSSGNLLSPPIPSPLPNNGNVNLRQPTLSREKSLPPIPPGETPALPTFSDRPRTVYTYDPRTLPTGSRPPHDFLPPSAPFRTPDTRRQSFSGIMSKPDLAIQTLPANSVMIDVRRSLGPRYDEFGFSRRSLGRMEYVQENMPRNTSPLPSTKRKSKFGFASLLGKKSTYREPEVTTEYIGHPFPAMSYSGSGGHDDTVTDFDNQRSLRMSVTSRKALEELVSQDPEFVAYRYPSTEQRLDLLR